MSLGKGLGVSLLGQGIDHAFNHIEILYQRVKLFPFLIDSQVDYLAKGPRMFLPDDNIEVISLINAHETGSRV